MWQLLQIWICRRGDELGSVLLMWWNDRYWHHSRYADLNALHETTAITKTEMTRVFGLQFYFKNITSGSHVKGVHGTLSLVFLDLVFLLSNRSSSKFAPKLSNNSIFAFKISFVLIRLLLHVTVAGRVRKSAAPKAGYLFFFLSWPELNFLA